MTNLTFSPPSWRRHSVQFLSSGIGGTRGPSSLQHSFRRKTLVHLISAAFLRSFRAFAALLSGHLRAMLTAGLAFVPLIADGAPPLELAFRDDGVAVQGSRPAARIVWMALSRERIGSHIEVRVHRGVAVAGADGVALIADPVATKRALWAVADIDGGGVGRAARPAGAMSQIPVFIQAIAGDTSVIVMSPETHLLVVSRPAGALAFDGADGGGLDADPIVGRITAPLARFRTVPGLLPGGVSDGLPGGLPAVVSLKSGDIVVAIDPQQIRSGEVVVP